MKNYFNQYEASNHLILMTAMLPTKNFIDGDCITEEERKMLKKVMKLVSDFSESVFERLGDGYKRSLINKAERNTIRIVSKNVHHINNTDMEDFIDSETLHEIIDQSADLDCAGCNRTDCKNCGIYKIKSYLHYDGISDNTDLCPFRKEELDLPQIDFEDF
jgi:Fe-S-cluster containining protein